MPYNSLFRPLSFLGNAPLAGLPSIAIKLLQMIQNAAVLLSSTSPREPMSHLSLSLPTGYCSDACIQNSHRLHNLLHLLSLTSLQPLQNPEVGKWVTPHGTIKDRHKITSQNIFVHSSLLVEWSSQPWMPNTMFWNNFLNNVWICVTWHFSCLLISFWLIDCCLLYSLSVSYFR